MSFASFLVCGKHRPRHATDKSELRVGCWALEVECFSCASPVERSVFDTRFLDEEIKHRLTIPICVATNKSLSIEMWLAGSESDVYDTAERDLKYAERKFAEMKTQNLQLVRYLGSWA